MGLVAGTRAGARGQAPGEGDRAGPGDVSAVPLAGALTRLTAVVVTRDAPLVASASPTGEVLGSLPEAEVVPILERSAGYLRIEDSAGACVWVHPADVWPLE